jgi:regulator of sigma E protease
VHLSAVFPWFSTGCATQQDQLGFVNAVFYEIYFITRFLDFLAIVSISLGILNLLPIPILDGGHLLYYLIESILGRPVSEEAQFLGQRLGIAMLVGLMGLAFYNDLARIFG